MAEISRRSPTVPVTAVTVTNLVMSVPELVMNCFAPFTTHSPPSSTARVLVLPASDPASGSVRPKAASFLPAQRSGSHCCFCSSVPPARIMPFMPRMQKIRGNDWEGKIGADC